MWRADPLLDDSLLSSAFQIAHSFIFSWVFFSESSVLVLKMSFNVPFFVVIVDIFSPHIEHTGKPASLEVKANEFNSISL